MISLEEAWKGAVFVDVSFDQGGRCFETIRATYTVDDVVKYCVANMAVAVGLSSTFALTAVAGCRSRAGYRQGDTFIKGAQIRVEPLQLFQ